MLLTAVLTAFGRADDWASLNRRIQGLPLQKAAGIVRKSELFQNSGDLEALEPKDLVDSVGFLALAEERERTDASGKTLQTTVKEIKAKGGIVDGRESEQANWLSNALERLKNLGFNTPKADLPSADPSVLSLVVTYFMWGVLGVLVAIFLVFAWRHFSKLERRKTVRALVEEDEPERTVDEWLTVAGSLEAEGRYREAVRALYLACLIRLDEAGVARFLRYETNWEHQHRIHASPKRPPSLDMLPATRMMDRVWYGFRTQGQPDVTEMRGIYEQVMRETLAK